MFSAAASPAAALTFEASVDAHFDILFDCATARANGSKTATERAAQPRRDLMPVVDPIAVAQDVTKERVKFQWTSLAVGAAAQRFQDRFAIALPHCGHDAAVFRLVLAHQRAHILRDVPAIQQPEAPGKFSLPHPLESFVAIA